MSHDGFRAFKRRHVLRLVRHVLDKHSRQAGAAAVLIRVVDECRAAAPRAACAICRRNRGLERVKRALAGGIQLGERRSQVIGMDHFIRRILQAHLPAMRGAGGRRDEEELASVGEGEVVRLGLDRGRVAKVDADAVAHDALAVPDFADGNGRVNVVKGDDDAAEGLEGRKGVDCGGARDEVADALELLGVEDVDVVEVGEEQRVGRRRGLL